MPRPPLELPRRDVIAAVSVPVLGGAAGCLETIDPRSSCADETSVSLQAVDHPVHVSNEFSEPVPGLPYGTERVVAAAIERGEAEVREYYAPALRSRYVVSGSDERYYRVSTTDRNPADVTGYEYAVEIETDGASSGGSASPFDDLPAADRDTIHSALGNDHLLDAPHYTDFSVVFAYEESSDRDASPFVPETDGATVAWDGHLLRFSFASTRSVRLTTTAVSAAQVADSVEGFADHFFDAHGLVLAALPDAQRDIVAEAIDGRYSECGSRSASFVALLDRLDTDDGEFAPLVAYEGTRYFTHVSVAPDEIR